MNVALENTVNMVPITYKTLNRSGWLFERYLLFREYQVSCAYFLQYFILYLSPTVRTTGKLYFDKTVAKIKCFQIAN